MKILILGVSGTVGKPLYISLSEEYDVHGTFCKNLPSDISSEHLHKFDIADSIGLVTLMETINPDLVVSSLTGNFEQQLSVHQTLENYLRKNTSGRMIFISTANVFDGDVRGQHSEKTAPHPISSYGKFKQNCEEFLQDKLGDRCLVIRLPKILDKTATQDWYEHAKTGIAKPGHNPVIHENLYFSLNTAENVANAIRYCVGVEKSGVLHLTSCDFMSIDDCMKFILAQKNDVSGYTSQTLTIESYCNALGSNDLTILRHNSDNKFCLSLVCDDADISARFRLTCEDVIRSTI